MSGGACHDAGERRRRFDLELPVNEPQEAVQVMLRLRVRRCVCGSPNCAVGTFAQQTDGLTPGAAPWGTAMVDILTTHAWDDASGARGSRSSRPTTASIAVIRRRRGTGREPDPRYLLFTRPGRLLLDRLIALGNAVGSCPPEPGDQGPGDGRG